MGEGDDGQIAIDAFGHGGPVLVLHSGQVAPWPATSRQSAMTTPARIGGVSILRVFGWVRRVTFLSIAAMVIWPMALQAILSPESIFGDGHGDRFEQLSYFAFENDNYQVLRPIKIDWSELHALLFPLRRPVASTDLVRALSDATYKAIRASVGNVTSSASSLSVVEDIIGLSTSQSLCFGGIDSRGQLQVDALVSAHDAEAFGFNSACIQDSGTHLRLRVVPTEFFDRHTLAELNPVRYPGALLVASIVNSDLQPVMSTCYEATRTTRYEATQAVDSYKRLVAVFSSRLLVSSSCEPFTLFDERRNQFGCAYAALGASGAVADLNSDGDQRTYSFPAPWRMIQCTVSGECSSLIFSQLWLSEWTVEATSEGMTLRHNFVNHKVIEVTVDSTVNIRIAIGAQILALLSAAYLTSEHDWYVVRQAKMAPWTSTIHATTSCAIAKIVRSSYNFVLAAQMVLAILQWRNQLTIDLLVGADTRQAIYRATACGTLSAVLMINVMLARTGDTKRQEIEPSVAHVVAFLMSITSHAFVYIDSVQSGIRWMLTHGMRSVKAEDIIHHAACRGSFVCTERASLLYYGLFVSLVVIVACAVGLGAQYLLQSHTRRLAVMAKRRISTGPVRPSENELRNTFTRFLDDRSRNIGGYDCSTQVYVPSPSGALLSTRTHLEVCGFVPATTLLF